MQDPNFVFMQQMHACHLRLAELAHAFCRSHEFHSSELRWCSQLAVGAEDRNFRVASVYQIRLPLDPGYQSVNEICFSASVLTGQESHAAEMHVAALLDEAVDGLPVGEHILHQDSVECASSQHAVETLPRLIDRLGDPQTIGRLDDLAELLAPFLKEVGDPVIWLPDGPVHLSRQQ
jgi:hypothetical protein